MPRGGRRTGAGRKPGAINRITAIKQAAFEIREIKGIKGEAARQAVTAAVVLGMVDEAAKWLKLLESRDERIVLAAMQYLTDRSDGKARQSVDVDIDDKRKTGSERLKEFIAQAAAEAGIKLDSDETVGTC